MGGRVLSESQRFEERVVLQDRPHASAQSWLLALHPPLTPAQVVARRLDQLLQIGEKNAAIKLAEDEVRRAFAVYSLLRTLRDSSSATVAKQVAAIGFDATGSAAADAREAVLKRESSSVGSAKQSLFTLPSERSIASADSLVIYE